MACPTCLIALMGTEAAQLSATPSNVSKLAALTVGAGIVAGYVGYRSSKSEVAAAVAGMAGALIALKLATEPLCSPPNNCRIG